MQTKKRQSDFEEASFEDVIDLTPMINVSLVLVIVFMCVCPLALISGIKASESKTGVGIGKTAKSENVNIVLTEEGIIKINDVIAEKNNFSTILRQALSNSVTKDVMLTADEKNIVNDVVEILDLAKQNGANKVIIMR